MAVKIERGGWVLIFLIGVALVGYKPESIRSHRSQQVDGWREQDRLRQRGDRGCFQASVAAGIFDE